MSDILLSVIIPTRNRAKHLGPLLDSLDRQEPVDFKWEVLVIDNGSSDDTSEVTRAKSKELSIAIRYVYEASPGLHHGRHRGVREARGVFLGFLDDDMTVSPSWIRGVEMLRSGMADAVVGPILPHWDMEPPKWLARMSGGAVFPYLTLLNIGPNVRSVDPLLVFGGSFFISKVRIFALGGFHPDSMPPELISYRGDGETALMSKFKEAGLRSYYDPSATAFHHIGPERQTIDYLHKRAFSQGISNSFTHIRTNEGKFTSRNIPSSVSTRKIDPRAALASLKRWLREKLPFMKYHKATIEQGLRRAYDAGWEFHQDAVAKDPELLKWVLKPDFLD